MTRAATIYDVARAAGVSHQTVAMYLRGHEGFRPETRERVRTAIAELGYRPNRTARALATRRSHRIAALVYELLEVGPSKTIQGAADRAREAGFVLDVITLDPRDATAVETALDAIGTDEFAGIIAFAPLDAVIDRLDAARFRVPLVAEREPGTEPGASAVARAGATAGAGAGSSHSSLSRVGIDLVVDHLRALGHARIGYLGGPRDWVAARARHDAVRSALARHGLEPCVILEGDWSAASGHRAVVAADLGRATALVGGNDQMALGALLALEQRGLSVPGDVSVTGFDDIPEAAYFRPPLTTVAVDYASQGRAITERLLELVAPDQAVGPSAAPAPKLVVRASTAHL